MPSLTIRDADPDDVAELARLEAAVFAFDRLSPLSFRRLVAAASAACRVARSGKKLAGYHLLLFRRGTAVARLYSIAVAPDFRGRGIAEALLRDAAKVARRRRSRRLRLEVRTDNAAAIRLYERLGYRRIGCHPGYYADGADAFGYERRLDGPEKNRTTSAEEDRSPRDSRVTLAYRNQIVRPDFAASAAALPAEATADLVHPPHR